MGGTVLVVDDDSTIAHLIEKILAREGYQVLASDSAVEAIERSRSYPDRIDLLISDIRMPVYNGFQIADAMEETRPGLRVLMISGYPDAENVIHCGRRWAFLAKPFNCSELLAAVSAAFEMRSAA